MRLLKGSVVCLFIIFSVASVCLYSLFFVEYSMNSMFILCINSTKSYSNYVSPSFLPKAVISTDNSTVTLIPIISVNETTTINPSVGLSANSPTPELLNPYTDIPINNNRTILPVTSHPVLTPSSQSLSNQLSPPISNTSHLIYQSSLLVNDLDFVNLLIKDANFKYPTISDCVAVIERGQLMVYVVINYGTLPYKTRYKIHNSYTLIYKGIEYRNILGRRNIYYISQVVGFSIQQTKFSNNLIQFTIHDKRFNIKYPVTTRILHSPPHKKHIGVCSYASSYNSLAEVISWVAYYKIVGVSNVMLYYAENITHIMSGLQKEVNSGFVRFFNFSWPLNRYHGYIQSSIQTAYINSCYYRNRHEFDYIIVLDVDEYLLSEKTPFNLYSSINSISTRRYDAYRVNLIYYYDY